MLNFTFYPTLLVLIGKALLRIATKFRHGSSRSFVTIRHGNSSRCSRCSRRMVRASVAKISIFRDEISRNCPADPWRARELFRIRSGRTVSLMISAQHCCNCSQSFPNFYKLWLNYKTATLLFRNELTQILFSRGQFVMCKTHVCGSKVKVTSRGQRSKSETFCHFRAINQPCWDWFSNNLSQMFF